MTTETMLECVIAFMTGAIVFVQIMHQKDITAIKKAHDARVAALVNAFNVPLSEYRKRELEARKQKEWLG